MSTVAPKEFNKKGGKHYKKNKSGRVRIIRERASVDVENGKGYYGTIVKMCGCDGVMVKARSDNQLYRAIIPGRMYNRGGSKNRMKIGDEVVVVGPLDVNVIGEIDRIIKVTDIDYGEITKNTNSAMFDTLTDQDDETDETYDLLLNMGRNKKSNKGAERVFSTEEEILAGINNTIVENSEELNIDENSEELNIDEI